MWRILFEISACASTRRMTTLASSIACSVLDDEIFDDIGNLAALAHPAVSMSV